MAEQWLTYRQLGELWNTTPEAARLRSRRANYQRRTNEQGTAEVLVEADDPVLRTGREAMDEAQQMGIPVPYNPDVPYDVAMASIEEMQRQVSDLLEQLNKTEALVDSLRKSLDHERQQVSQLMTALLRRGEKPSRGGWLFWRRSTRGKDEGAGQVLPRQTVNPPDSPDAEPAGMSIPPDKPL
jgi:hypothetical protein